VSNNIFPTAMRDTRDDLRTGWTRNGLWEREASAPSTGVMGLGGLGRTGMRNLGRIPRTGREHVLAALNDRDIRVRDRVTKALLSSSPEDTLADIAQSDVAEILKPTGKPVVFKNLAFEAAKQARTVEDALVRAAPGTATYEGAVAAQIIMAAHDGVVSSGEAKEALNELYEIVATSAVTGISTQFIIEHEGLPEEMFGDEGLGDLGKSFFKKLKKVVKKVGAKVKTVVKKYGKPLLIAGAVVGAAMIPGVLPALGAAAGAVGSAIGSAASWVGGGIASGVSAIFGKGQTQQQVIYEEQAGTLEEQAAALEASGQTAAAQQLRAQAEALRYASAHPEGTQTAPAPVTAQTYDQYGYPMTVPMTAAPRPAAVPAPSILDTIAGAALSVYAIKRMASASKAPGDVQNYEAQRETLVREIMTTTNVSRQEAERLADQAIQQIEGEKGAAPIAGEVRAGMDSGMMLPVLAVGAVLVLSMAKGGGGGGGRGGRRRRNGRR
jgi:hypothetical protein